MTAYLLCTANLGKGQTTGESVFIEIHLADEPLDESVQSESLRISHSFAH